MSLRINLRYIGPPSVHTVTRQIFPDTLGQRLSFKILSKEGCISLQKEKKHTSFGHHSMNDIHWHDSLYLLTAQRFFYIHDNLIASVLLCVDPIIWSFILNFSLYKDHKVLQFQFCPFDQEPRLCVAILQVGTVLADLQYFCNLMFSGPSHICLYL